MRYSYQRTIIKDVIFSTNCHPTADWIFKEVRKIIPNISLGTVYRNLKQLTDRGQIKIIQDGSIMRYDGNMISHHHLKCEECNEIIDINFDNIDLKRVVKTKFDFELSDIDITITGKCNKHR